ncbi:cytochrome P450 [Polyangium aurulentum]|uniref:cytochrome P450 n=1 Tax=Polyangium aurulentum TaxID=2567896 RepID=UPI0010ADDC2F|nr:cytochrome P450 [Polyangium aurulentum]UQA56678.1 cytochrome P450 [Polyangium aurulentum]
MSPPLASPSPARRLPLPPVAPGALPLLGHAVPFRRDPLAFILRAAAAGRVTEMRLATESAYLVRDPEDIERVLVGEHKKFIKDRFTHRLEKALGEGLVTSEGETWRRHRRLMAPAFHHDRIAQSAAIMVDAAERTAAAMRPGEVRDIHADMMRLTLDIVARAMFGTEVPGAAETVGRAVVAMMERFNDTTLLVFPWLERLPLPGNLRFHEAMRTLDAIVLRLVRERREKGGGGTDLLGMLLAAQDEAGAGLSDRELRDELMTIFLAGHETTALALSFAFVLLSQNPAVEERMVREIDEVLAGRTPEAADVARLRFTHAVVLEVMRLYPPVWGIGREALEDVTIGGYHIPRGSQLWLMQWVNHRDPRYFPEPDRFSPERWLDGLERRLPRFAYYPFGGGPRICIGNAFATMEAVLVLATIVRRRSIRVRDDRPLALAPTVTLRPRGPVEARIGARAS